MNPVNRDIQDLASLFETPVHNLPKALQLSEKIDSVLGFEIQKIETLITATTLQIPSALSREHSWVGLDPRALLTPYTEFIEILSRIPQIQNITETWIDLGAGYGRLGFVLNFARTNFTFLGFEVEALRTAEANRVFESWNLSHQLKLETRDLNTSDLPGGSHYFLYDLGSNETIRCVLEKLRLQASASPLTLIARGRASRHWIEREHPWLTCNQPPIHLEFSSIYFSF